MVEAPSTYKCCCPDQQELEKALSKHEIIGVKALAQKTKASPSSSSSGSPGRNSPAARSSTCSSPGGSSSSSTSSRAISEFKRGIRETEAEAAATQQRLQQLRDSKAQLEAATGGAAAAWRQLQQEQAQLREETAQTQADRWVLQASCKGGWNKQHQQDKRSTDVDVGRPGLLL